MKFKRCKIPVHLRFIAAVTCVAIFGGCATTSQQVSGLQVRACGGRTARGSLLKRATRKTSGRLPAGCCHDCAIARRWNSANTSAGGLQCSSSGTHRPPSLSGWWSIVESSTDCDQWQHDLSFASAACFLWQSGHRITSRLSSCLVR